MRTIAIVFALAVVGGIAPAVPFGGGHAPAAVMLFAAALVMFVAGCVVTGWLLSERRTLVRMAASRRVEAPMPSAAPAPRALPAGPLRWAADAAPAEPFRIDAVVHRASAAIAPRMARREPAAASRSLD